MEKKLTIAHIAPYLPYGLQYRSVMNGSINELHDLSVEAELTDWMRPILRPLSQLTQEIEHNGGRFVPVDRLENTYCTLKVRATIEQLVKDNRWVNQCEYLLIQHLFEWHFDVFGLIDDGLAIEKGAEK